MSEYAPGLVIDRVAPRPLLVILANADEVVPPELTRAAFERAGAPKQLLELDCGHYGVYEGQHQQAAIEAAVAWFHQHL
jgi:fermentation-respiration switch protein FrsA (DUF1100 family)